MALLITPAFLNYSKTRASNISEKSIRAVLEMHAEGATVPFMARYRKEKTGNLDEVQIRTVIDQHETWTELVKRKEFVITEIAKQGSLTDELKRQIEVSMELNEVEELYRPYKKKKKTKAKIAMDAGMSPLADWIWGLGHGEVQDASSLEVKAKEFINPTAGFATYEECLRGAQHILTEKLSSNIELRAIVKAEYFDNGKIESQKTKDFKPTSKYAMYAEFTEAVKSLQLAKASHRYLALRRGWQDGELKVTIIANDEMLFGKFITVAMSHPGTQADEFLKETAKHALQVHVIPSITNELHSHIKDLADQHAIQVFADNVRRVLMSSPFGPKVVLGIDPGIRTGCKVALIDKSGRFVTHTVIYTQTPEHKEQAKKLFSETLSQIHVDAIAVGNGTAGRETETFVRDVLKEINKDVPVVLVNESGASVYSASEVARQEFPDLDLTVRGAVSIARRLQDPLAELVKIEPKSIGVGQYQHDVNQSALKKSLTAVVESCVNNVGVDVNTASESLLQYVSGIGPATAKNIVTYRGEKGLFQERSDILKIPSFSSKAYEQAAGFLRIPGGKVQLDTTGIHPERYQAVRDMLTEAGVTLSQALGGNVEPLKAIRDKWKELIGEYTFDDILSELAKPGRDPRDAYKIFKFREDIHELKDLKADMICLGIVTNVTNFGAFVDIGVHQDGLVHLSQLSHDFITDPKTVVQPGDQVTVKVLAVDLEKKQISLTMKLEERARPEPRPARPRAERPQREKSARGGGGGRGQGQGPRPPGSRPSGPRPSRPARPRREETEEQFRKIRPVEEEKRYRQDFEELLGGQAADVSAGRRDQNRDRNRDRRDDRRGDRPPHRGEVNSGEKSAAAPAAPEVQGTGIMAARARREAQLKAVGKAKQASRPRPSFPTEGTAKTELSSTAKGPQDRSQNRQQNRQQDRPRGQGPRRPVQPFNNPFATLTDLKKDSKS